MIISDEILNWVHFLSPMIEKLCDKNIAIQGMEKSFKDKKKVKGTWE